MKYKNYQNEPRFNGVYSRNNLPKTIKDGVYVIDLDEYADIGTHWIALFCKINEIVYFDSFGVEYVPEKIKKFNETWNMKQIIHETFVTILNERDKYEKMKVNLKNASEKENMRLNSVNSKTRKTTSL